MSFGKRLMSHERPNGNKKNDWDGLTWSEMNSSQRIAKVTRGSVTIPNIVSALGAAVTMSGLYQYMRGNYGLGTGLVIGGRVADVLDGTLAKALEVRGKVGAFLDASLDKAVGIAAVGALTYVGDFQPTMTTGIVLTQSGIVYENMRIQELGGKATPNLKGKLATFALWGAGGAYMTASTIESAGHETAAAILRCTGHAAALGSIALGASAWHEYRKTVASLTQSPDATL